MMAMREILYTIVVVALSARVIGAQARATPVSISEVSARLHPPSLLTADRIPVSIADTARRPSRRSTVTGAVTGAVVGGLATAGYILNATVQDCVYNVSTGSPCPKKNYVPLQTVVIAAGAAAGAFIGVRIAHWLSRRF
jgi:hypothetical protein